MNFETMFVTLFVANRLEGYDYDVIKQEEEPTENTKLQENDEILLQSIELSNEKDLNYEYAKTIAQKLHHDQEQRVLNELDSLKLEMENKKSQYLEHSKQRRKELVTNKPVEKK